MTETPVTPGDRSPDDGWRPTVDSLQVDATRFLKAVLDNQVDRALELLRDHPELATHDIHCAAAAGHADALRALVEADPGTATRAAMPDGAAPLIYAVLGGIKTRLGVPDARRVEVVRTLLDAGASPNTSVPLDDSAARIPALYFPCDAGDTQVARLLLDRGANPNDGESVFHAAQRNHRACLELLLAHGADLSTPHAEWGNTPLYFLASHREQNPITPSVTLGMQWLLEHGADPNMPSHVKNTAAGDPGLAELPIHKIATSGRPASVARLLVEHGAVIDAVRGDGRTAFTLAVRSGNAPVADYLASVGADTTRLTPFDRLRGACESAQESEARRIVGEHPDVMASLAREDAQALGLAVADGRADSVRLMVELGWPLTTEGEWGGTPLHWAAWSGRVELTRLLIEQGAPVNTRDASYGSSPIAWACHGSTNTSHGVDADYVAIVGQLLDAGATRAESYNRWNEAPESMACPAVVGALKERGFAG